MSGATILFDPLVPWPVLAAAAALSALLVALALWRGLPGWPWRGLAAAAILLGLAGPALQRQEGEALPDIVVMVEDESASQRIGERPGQRRAAAEALAATIAARPGTELRRVRVEDDPGDGGTRAMTALAGALGDVPPAQLAGVIVLSDGQVHDAALAPALPAPMHLLLTGRRADWDRRLVVEAAPAFAILGEPVTLRLRVEDQGAVPPGAPPPVLSVSVDGGPPRQMPALVGAPFELRLDLPHGGINVVQLQLPAAPGELTERNNDAVIEINGVRDRLRVLLVSGEPYPGGRTWRNLLKSDSAVDLVHFTILRPPEKQDGVPVSELSLIAFPTRELFLDKIDEFDLIIFDRYRRRGILPGQYLDNIRRYVEAGGAVLMAAGPEFAGANSLAHSELGEILPARPTGRVVEAPLRPQITELGQRHPVTAEMDGKWGDWLRQIEVTPAPEAQVVMSGPEGGPLLLLGRRGEGRVALLASDHAWLWARGYQGGGPQLELLRRLAHWMMKEPDLEEEALRAEADGAGLVVTRRSLAPGGRRVTVTGPDGEAMALELREEAPGRLVGRIEAPQMGLYRIADGEMEAVAAVGPQAPKEFEETIASAAPLEAAVAASGGAVRRLEDGVPALRWMRAGRAMAGRGWIGLTPRGASVTTSVSLRPLLPAWAGLLAALGLVLAGWLREGWRRR